MEITIGEKLHGFTVRSIRNIPESDAELVEMVYEKTNTPLCWVKSKESNKLFAVAFETLPEDSTGVFHILEHSVLCGSDKYPVKEPFVELLKSSMNTFLNAMTFPDKTLYPVSSRNDRDFLNLSGVYLDAVFAPKILNEPNIFYQEGWHYEKSGDELIYNGVVFNEMKGATSSVDEIAYQGMQTLLFPDSIYRFNSGGAPENIPDLTYEKFIETYKKNYHPSNAKIYLDGDVPLDDILSMIDGYLSRFEPGTAQTLTMQAPKAAEATVYYEADDDGTPKAQMVLGKLVCDYSDKTKLLACNVICDVLCGSNDAPLTRAILEAGLSQDVSLQIADEIAQPFMMLRLQNMDEKRIDEAKALIVSVCKELEESGIDNARFKASINRLSFRLRQKQEPQGLIRCMNALDSWLYGGDPMEYLHYGDTIEELRKMEENGGFMSLLHELLIDENGLCTLTVLPSSTYGEETRAKEAARLAAEKAAFGAEKLLEIEKREKELDEWQKKSDTPEQLATLPVLSLSEIGDKPTYIGTDVETCGGVRVLCHDIPSNGIVHLTAYFNLSDCTASELTDITFLTELLGEIAAGDTDALTLQNEIKTYIGSLHFDVDVFSKKGERNACTPYLTVRCSVLSENLEKAESIIAKILNETHLDCPERIREILMQAEIEAKQSGMMNGHSLAAACTMAHYSSSGAVKEAISGFTYIDRLHRFARDFDNELDGFVKTGSSVMKKAICKERMILGVTADSRVDISEFISLIKNGAAAPDSAQYKTALPKKMGIKIPAQVSYAALGYNLAECGMEYDGSARLVSNIISLDHLWNVVRVQNGAYGVGLRIRRNGNLFCYSYRDPSPAKTLEVYRNLSDFVKAYVEKGESIDKYIISTTAETEPLVSAAHAGLIGDGNYFSGFSYEDSVKERKEILNASLSEIANRCDMLDSLRDGAVCVVGYADALKECKKEELTVFDI